MPTSREINSLTSEQLKGQPTSRSVVSIESQSIESDEGVYRPVLLSGPTATPGETDCLIEWSLDTDEPAGYHRVRYKRSDAESWTYTPFTETASWEASVEITGLDADTSHDYQVQSCALGDGRQAFDFAPDPAATFNTEPMTTPLSISNTDFTGGRNQISYSFDTNKEAEGWMDYNQVEGSNDGESAHESGATSFSGIVDGLPAGDYQVRAHAITATEEDTTSWVTITVTAPF